MNTETVLSFLETKSLSTLLDFSTKLSILIKEKYDNILYEDNIVNITKEKIERTEKYLVISSANSDDINSRLCKSLDEIIMENDKEYAYYYDSVDENLCDSIPSDITVEELDKELDEIAEEIYREYF